MLRAYSLVTFTKSMKDAGRTFSGIATSPAPDRIGDVIEPDGVKFKNPLALLLYHDSKKPVGETRFGKATKDGIPFDAVISSIDRPGVVKDRIDEALDSLHANPPLIKGVSIGFRPLVEPIYIKETGGFRYPKVEVLELSMVVIPAHQDATIHTVKSISTQEIAALGDEGASPSAGATASMPRKGRDRPMKKTISERITELKAERKGIATRMETLMQPVIDGTGELDDTQKKSYDDDTATLNEVDADIVRYEALERATVMPKAAPVSGASFDDASASRGANGNGRSISVKSPDLPPGIAFTRAVICKAAGRLFGMSPVEVARERYPSHPEIAAYIKAAVTAQSTAVDTALVTTPTTLVSEFLDYLMPRTIVGQFGQNGIPSLTRVPFNSRIQEQTSSATANWVGAGKQKPVTRINYDDQSLTWAKLACLAVMQEELIRFSTPSGEGRVRDALAKAIVEKMDITFINPAAAPVSNVSPGSILYGVAATSHSGTDADAVRAAVLAALNHYISVNADVTNLVWIMPNSIALALQLVRNSLGQREFPDVTMRGGMLEGFPVVTSRYAATVQGSPTSNIVALVNASEIFLADDGGVNIDMSNQATIEMSDDPENESGTQVNMFQTNQVVFRAERFVTWARGRSSSVVWFDAVGWTA